MRTKSFIKTSVNVTETKIDEGAWKKISHTKLQAWTWNNIWTKIETTFHSFYALLFLWNLVFKFSIVLIGNFFIISTTILFTFFFLPFFHIRYIADLQVYPVPLRFFKRTSKILMSLGVLLFSFQLQNVLVMFFFFMKNAYLITAKITLAVNSCL